MSAFVDRVREERIADLEREVADLERRLRESPTEQVGWIDEHGQLWALGMRSGDVTTDRPVFARAILGEGTDG